MGKVRPIIDPGDKLSMGPVVGDDFFRGPVVRGQIDVVSTKVNTIRLGTPEVRSPDDVSTLHLRARSIF